MSDNENGLPTINREQALMLRAVKDMVESRLTTAGLSRRVEVPSPTIEMEIPAPRIEVHNQVQSPEVNNEVNVHVPEQPPAAITVNCDMTPVARAMQDVANAMRDMAEMFSQLLQVLASAPEHKVVVKPADVVMQRHPFTKEFQARRDKNGEWTGTIKEHK